MSATSTEGSSQEVRNLHELTRSEALHLLTTVKYGRVIFTSNALPAVRPVNHLLDDGEIVIRTSLSARLVIAVAQPIIVAYEVDQIDPDQRLGWSVVVTGYARQIEDPDRISRYEQLLLPWVDHNHMDVAIGIQTELVTGFRLAPR